VDPKRSSYSKRTTKTRGQINRKAIYVLDSHQVTRTQHTVTWQTGGGLSTHDAVVVA